MQKDIMDEFISSSITANQEIYHLINSSKNSLKEKKTLGFGGDISIEMDLKAEEIFIKHLSSFGKIFSEESGLSGSGDLTIVIDPIDGSDNFKANFPYFGSSVALKSEKEVLAGVITNLANGDIFIKAKDYFKRGNLFESDFIDVTKNSFSEVGLFEKGYECSPYAKRLREKEIKYRVPGAVALSLAYAHDLKFVIFEGKPREFDLCAGRFMCSDLFLFENDKIFIVSQDRATFEILREII